MPPPYSSSIVQISSTLGRCHQPPYFEAICFLHYIIHAFYVILLMFCRQYPLSSFWLVSVTYLFNQVFPEGWNYNSYSFVSVSCTCSTQRVVYACHEVGGEEYCSLWWTDYDRINSLIQQLTGSGPQPYTTHHTLTKSRQSIF